MEKTNWIRFHERPKNQKFICPHCNELCFCHAYDKDKVNICDYAYCPHCGMLVDSKRKKG